MPDSAAPLVVFLDRDGVINQDRPDYIKTLSELVVFPGAGKAIAKLKKRGFWVFVASNQAAVGKGLMTVQILGLISQQIQQELELEGGNIDTFLYCPHTDADNCDCRKPQVGLFLRALDALPSPPGVIFVVGDSERDLKVGHLIGAITVLVLSGRIKIEDLEELNIKPDFVVEGITEAVDLILKMSGNLEGV